MAAIVFTWELWRAVAPRGIRVPPFFFFFKSLRITSRIYSQNFKKFYVLVPQIGTNRRTDRRTEHKVTKFFSCISECTEEAKMYGNFPTLRNCCTAISSSWEACDSSLDSYGCQVFLKERMESFGLDLQKIEISCIYGSAVYDKKFFWIFSSIVTCVTGAVLPRALDIRSVHACLYVEQGSIRSFG